MTNAPAEWNKFDQIELDKFLNDRVGAKLIAHLRFERPTLFSPTKAQPAELAIQVSAYAAGIEAAIEKILTLSQPNRGNPTDVDHVEV